jgi:hypothetical protein
MNPVVFSSTVFMLSFIKHDWLCKKLLLGHLRKCKHTRYNTLKHTSVMKKIKWKDKNGENIE